jgi:predicted transcriptional regulator YdeE
LLSKWLVVSVGALGGVWTFAANGQMSAAQSSGRARITHQHVSAFSVVGISARTSNAKEAGPDGIIPKQWQTFFHDGVAARIPNKTGAEIYAVYADYASDHNGEYTFIIGCKVKDGTASHAGLTAAQIPSGDYAVISSKKGPVARVVPAAWQDVFKMEGSGELHRTYRADFELYDQRTHDPQNAQVDLFLGVK